GSSGPHSPTRRVPPPVGTSCMRYVTGRSICRRSCAKSLEHGPILTREPAHRTADSPVDEAAMGKVLSYEGKSYRRLSPLEEASGQRAGEPPMALSLVLHRVADFDA